MGLVVAPQGVGRPYGFWGLNGFVTPAGLTSVSHRFHLTTFQVACDNPGWAVRELLPMVRAAGLQVTLRMTPDHDAYTDAAGDFDREAWTRALSAWLGSGVQEFIDDGTLAGHMLLDDVDTFRGRSPDAADLDAMARDSKDLLPGLLTFVRQDATALPVPDEGAYIWLDATVLQYESRRGDVGRYAVSETERAAHLGIGVISGLNIADGGDGSSGQPGWRPGFWAMSAQEIATYGAALAAVPGGMFLAWEYDGHEQWSDGTVGSTYFDRPELQGALADLGRRMASAPVAPLVRKFPPSLQTTQGGL